MSNAERLPLPLELERRLKKGVGQLREMRETLEELVQIADAIQPLLGVNGVQVQAKAAPRPAAKAAGVRTEAAKRPRTQAGSAPSVPVEPDEVPEWRKVFPALSANVPGRSKGGTRSS